MQRLFVTFIVSVVILSCNAHPNPSRNIAKETNKLVSVINSIYDNLAIAVEKADKPLTRQFSIFASAVSYWLTKDFPVKEQDRLKIVSEIKNFAKAYSPDVVASDFKTNLDLLVTYIDKSITDVKTACPPSATTLECIKEYNKYISDNRQRCVKYFTHVHLFELTRALANSTEADSFLKKLLNTLHMYNDETTLTLFLNSLNEYSKVFAALREIHDALKKAKGPCTFF